MPRKPLPLGTHGDIRLYGHVNGKWTPKDSIAKGKRPAIGKWRAITNYRGHDGETRQVERGGTSVTAATNALRAHLTDASGSSTVLTATSRVEDAVPAYLKRIHEDCAPTTCDRYTSVLNTHVIPGIGRLLFTECDVSKLHQFDAGLVSHRQRGKKDKSKPRPRLAPGTRRVVREVVRGLLQIAVEAGVLEHNPVTSTRRIKGGPQRPANSMTAAAVPVFFAKLDNDPLSKRADLPDIIRTLFGLGCRIGEALALSWEYINLGDEPVEREAFGRTRVIPPRSIWINATISEPKGQGAIRSPVKTARSNRVVGIPEFLYLVMTLRRPADTSDNEPVFQNGGPRTWRSPKVVGFAISRMRDRLGYQDFRSHGGRKTAATVLYYDGHLDDRVLADQFGHVNGDFTRRNYVGEGVVSPQAALLLDRLLSGTTQQ